MIRIFISLMLVAAALSGVAAAAETNVTVSAESTDRPADGCDRHIDDVVSICDHDLDGDEAVITFYSESTEVVTLRDAGVFIEGGTIVPHEEYLRSEQRSTIRVPVTVVDGFAGVAITTRRSEYALPIEEASDPFVPGSARHEDAAIAAGTMFGLFAIGFPASVFAVRRVLGGVNRVW